MTTPQEILDAEGFHPVCTFIEHEVGEIIIAENTGSVFELGLKMKIIGTLTAHEFYALAKKYYPGYIVNSGHYFYKIIVE